MNGLWLLTNGLAATENWSYWSAVFVLVLYAMFLLLSYTSLSIDYCGASLKQQMFIYAPISLNFAWVVLAAILDFTNTVMNEKLDWTKKENRTAVGGPDWSMGILVLAALLATYLALVKCDFVYAVGTVWALVGVTRQQEKGSKFPHTVNEKVHDMAQVLAILVTCAGFIAVISVLCSKPARRMQEKLDPLIQELKSRYIPLSE
jgi:hypothetical protein